MRVEWSVAGWSFNERKWIIDKCIEVEISVARWNVVECSVGLSNRVSNIIGRYLDSFFINILNFVIWVFLFLHLYILNFMYVLFCIFSFHRANWHSSANFTEVFSCFFSVVSRMSWYNAQRRGTACTLPKSIVLFCVLFVCKCVLCYCHWVSTQWQLTDISIYQHI